jgi:signal transduction histidine kinase
MIIGGALTFFMIIHLSKEEAREYLTYEMERIIHYHETHKDLPDFNKIANIYEGVRTPKPIFKDTLILETGDNEMVPYKQLFFSIEHNEQDFTLEIRHLLLGLDDIAEATLAIVLGLMILIYISIYLVLVLVARKIWNPFYLTMQKLNTFQTDKPLPVFAHTNIKEFESLNTTLTKLLKKISEDYKNTKEFNENASHELQTHLAVIKASTEKLIEKADTSGRNDFFKDLNRIHSSTSQLSNAQKSLLLLSRINNMEFKNKKLLNLKTHLANALEIFQENIKIRDISLNLSIDDCYLEMDAGLADILTGNLLKNAVKHNFDGGKIIIILSKSYLSIKNTGVLNKFAPTEMMKRFVKGKEGNTGIGLAIVSQIAEIYSFKMNYTIEDEMYHKIEIFFS